MKNRLMIVRGENNIHSEQETQELYHFLTLVDGNYRNAIYIECADGQGYMLTMDRDAKPVLYLIQKFYDLTGELPSSDEMMGTLNSQTVECLYRKWLLWNTDSKCRCGICEMYRQQKKKERRC